MLWLTQPGSWQLADGQCGRRRMGGAGPLALAGLAGATARGMDLGRRPHYSSLPPRASQSEFAYGWHACTRARACMHACIVQPCKCTTVAREDKHSAP